jgi:hypothetical protein
MDFGIVTAKIDEIGYIAHAENLGFSHCWVTASPIIRSNGHSSRESCLLDVPAISRSPDRPRAAAGEGS